MVVVVCRTILVKLLLGVLDYHSRVANYDSLN